MSLSPSPFILWANALSFKEKSLEGRQDRKSTRLNSSHLGISYAVFCLKKKKMAYYATLDWVPTAYISAKLMCEAMLSMWSTRRGMLLMCVRGHPTLQPERSGMAHGCQT